jgi:hypothetical protein
VTTHVAAPAPSAWTPASTPIPALDEAADLATVQVLSDALRQRLGAVGQDLLDRFEQLHRHDRMLTEIGRDIDVRRSELAGKQAAVVLLEQLVEERRQRLMAEILVIETMRQAAAALEP